MIAEHLGGLGDSALTELVATHADAANVAAGVPLDGRPHIPWQAVGRLVDGKALGVGHGSTIILSTATTYADLGIP